MNTAWLPGEPVHFQATRPSPTGAATSAANRVSWS